MYLNPSAAAFKRAINSEIYVDKTGLIEYTNKYINTQQCYMCVSRPRRFGKTMAMNMLAAYYSVGADSADLFKDYKIAQADTFQKYINKYNVLRLDMAKLWNKVSDIDQMLANLEKVVLRDIFKEFPDVDYMDKQDLITSMSDVYFDANRQFVILIDEWDCIFRTKKDDKKAQERYLNFLRDWLKDQDYIALVYMTGILPIKKYGRHSALNMFYEYSMEDQGELEEFTGFISGEVLGLCQKYNMDYNQCKAWYDGYSLCNMKEIYNPISVVNAMLSKSYKNYWNKTETYEALKVYIELNYDGLKDIILSLMSGERQRIDTSNFSNDMDTFESADDVLTLLIHLGYLGYDSERSEVFIPNNEIRAEFATSVRNSKVLTEVAKAIRNADEMLEATLAGDGNRVAEIIEQANLETSILQYNDENALAYTISLAYYTARNKYKVVRELPTGKGFADLVFMPLPHCLNLPAMVVELKWNHSAKTAIKQIKEKEYPKLLKDYTGEMLLIGINYSKRTKKHTCSIEKCLLG